jgi:hypothetical protein
MESDSGEALLTSPDLEGSEPPKLTTINGDLGELKIRSCQSRLDIFCCHSLSLALSLGGDGGPVESVISV